MEKTRIQFDLSEKDIKGLDELKAEIGATSRAEVLRNALNIYATLSGMSREGGRIQIVKNDGRIIEPHLPGINDQ